MRENAAKEREKRSIRRLVEGELKQASPIRVCEMGVKEGISMALELPQ